MTDASARNARQDTEEAGTRRSLRNLFKLWRKRGGETDLRDAIEELIEENEETETGVLPLESTESSLLLNVLKFGDLNAYDVMVPRADIKAVADDIDLKGLIQTVREHGHSRLPVYGENLDDIIGVVHIKDVLPSIFEPEKFQLKRILREPVFVSPSIRLLDLLLQMRLARAHMVLVVDEFGGTDGLLTIEDLVEEIVGEIEDEHDVAQTPTLARRVDGTLDVNGRTTIELLEQEIGRVLSDDERREIDTVGGLIFSLLGRIPERGEVVRHPSGVEFEVLDVDPRRIRRLRVRPPTTAPAAP